MEREGTQSGGPGLWPLLFAFISPPVSEPLVCEVAEMKQRQRMVRGNLTSKEQVI